jgi:hypothetical protein
VFHHILDAFLHNAEETGRLIKRHCIRNIKNLQMDGQGRAPRNLMDMVFDRRAQSGMLQQRGMKPVRERVHIVRKLLQLFTKWRQRSSKFTGYRRRVVFQGCDFQDQGGQSLAHIIVQITGDSLPLMLLRRQQLRRQFFQLHLLLMQFQLVAMKRLFRLLAFGDVDGDTSQQRRRSFVIDDGKLAHKRVPELPILNERLDCVQRDACLPHFPIVQLILYSNLL